MPESRTLLSGSGSPVVQGFGDCHQLGEVRPPAVYSCPVSGDAGRHVSQGGLPVGSSSISLSGSGEFFSPISVAPSEYVAAGVAPHGFAGAFSSLRSLMHASFAVAPQRSLVPRGGRPGRSNSSVAGVHKGSSLVAQGRRGCLVSISRFLLRLCCCIPMCIH